MRCPRRRIRRTSPLDAVVPVGGRRVRRARRVCVAMFAGLLVALVPPSRLYAVAAYVAVVLLPPAGAAVMVLFLERRVLGSLPAGFKLMALVGALGLMFLALLALATAGVVLIL